MNILGINSGIGASVCLLQDGRITMALQEERLSRQKSHMGFPYLTLAYLFDTHPDVMTSLDCIAFSQEKSVLYSKEDMLQRYDVRFGYAPKPWKQAIAEVLPDAVVNLFNRHDLTAEDILTEQFLEREIVPKNIRVYRHHVCHAAAAYYGLMESPEKRYLIFTLDGGGDGECARVSIGQHGKLEPVAITPSGNSIGNLYSNVTYMLGFMPHEHEYKVMGMAPYVPRRYFIKPQVILESYLTLDNDNQLVFRRLTPEKTTWTGKQMVEDFKRIRFDNLCGGIQAFTEQLLTQWVNNGMLKTGCYDILLAGGVFMNVKANKAIANLPAVESINVFPSCGDESNAIGAAFLAHHDLAPDVPIAFSSCCLGPSPEYDLDAAREKYRNLCEFVEMENPDKAAARLIAMDYIVARCSGPMEFGARALGNRSLLCNPFNIRMVERINRAIKRRDFWMPFAPAVMIEHAHDYLVIPKSMPPPISPYMMFAFDTTKRRDEIRACLHPADKTARAQIVTPEINPEFHRLLYHYSNFTGGTAVMNTSFNVHGQPIVMGSMDALEIFVNSDIDHLFIGDTHVTKK